MYTIIKNIMNKTIFIKNNFKFFRTYLFQNNWKKVKEIVKLCLTMHLWWPHCWLGCNYSNKFIVAKKEEKELTIAKVNLNSGIIAVLVGVKFVAST